MVGANGGILLHQDAAPLRENGLDLADVEANVRKVRARCRRLAPVRPPVQVWIGHRNRAESSRGTTANRIGWSRVSADLK